MDMGYVFYMAEAEGLLPTRAGKINAAIKEVKSIPDADITDVMRALSRQGLDYEDLSEREYKYIKAELF